MNIAADDGLMMLPSLDAGGALVPGMIIPMTLSQFSDSIEVIPFGLHVAHRASAGRALLRSWKSTVPRIAEVLHAASSNPPDGAGMALWLNPDMSHRIDMSALRRALNVASSMQRAAESDSQACQ